MTAVLSLAAGFGQNALSLLYIKPQRGFTGADGTQIVAHATIEESHTDELVMTDHPVEQGAVITDHAYVQPAEVVITAGWSNSPNNTSPLASATNNLLGFAAAESPALSALIGAGELASGVFNLLDGNQDAVKSAYDQLLTEYRARTLFSVLTGKRSYQNMLIKLLTTTTNKQYENAMLIRITFRQMLMAQTQTVTVPNSANMANPENNGAVENMGTTYPVPSPNINVSALPS